MINSVFVPDCEIDDIESAEVLTVTTRLLQLRDGRFFLSPGGEIDEETAHLLRRRYGAGTACAGDHDGEGADRT